MYRFRFTRLGEPHSAACPCFPGVLIEFLSSLFWHFAIPEVGPLDSYTPQELESSSPLPEQLPGIERGSCRAGCKSPPPTGMQHWLTEWTASSTALILAVRDQNSTTAQARCHAADLRALAFALGAALGGKTPVVVWQRLRASCGCPACLCCVWSGIMMNSS